MLKAVREQRGWNQQELARHLGVSQTLVSFWENGTRPLPRRRVLQLQSLGVKLNPTELPLRPAAPTHVDFAQELANFGYPGFEHFRNDEPAWNPGQFLVMALSQNNLDRRVAEALPWLVLNYPELNWEWVRREAKVKDLQNRLGFTLALARKLAEGKGRPEAVRGLKQQEEVLHRSLLAKEDTYSNERMTQAERSWLRANRPPEAAAWNVLSDMETNYLTHA